MGAGGGGYVCCLPLLSRLIMRGRPEYAHDNYWHDRWGASPRFLPCACRPPPPVHVQDWLMVFHWTLELMYGLFKLICGMGFLLSFNVWFFFSYIFLGVFVYIVYLCRPSEASTWYCVIPGGYPPQNWQSLPCAGEELDLNPGLHMEYYMWPVFGLL